MHIHIYQVFFNVSALSYTHNYDDDDAHDNIVHPWHPWYPRYATYIDVGSALSSPFMDPNEALGFWCVTCPVGADCSQPGTTLDSVNATADYFVGLDGNTKIGL